MGGKFQNIHFETPTVPGIIGSEEGRIIGTVYTSTEGYSDSPMVSRPFPLLEEQNWLLLLLSFSLKCSTYHGVLPLVKMFSLL